MKYLLIVIFLFSFAVSGFSITVFHDEQSTIVIENNQGFFSIELIGDISIVDEVYFNFRYFSHQNYQPTKMDNTLSINKFEVILPGIPVDVNQIEYYFEITTKDNLSINYPQEAPHVSFFSQLSRLDRFQDKFVRLLPDTSYVDDDFVIAISFWKLSDVIDLSSVSLHINNRKVTQNLVVANNIITYRQKYSSVPNYTYYVSAQTKDGHPIRSEVWTIRTAHDSLWEIPFESTGYARLYGMYRKHDDSTDVSSVKDASFEYRVHSRINDFSVENHMFFSDNESSAKQPVNKYFLGLGYKPVSLYLGDYSPEYTRLSVSNTNIRGVHAYLRLPFFRFMTSYGETVRSLSGNEIKGGETDNVSYYPGTFGRYTFSFRTELGKESTFFSRRDGLNWGLSFVKNKDKINSIDQKYYLGENGLYSVTPKDNIVVSTDLRYSLLKNRLVLGGEVAMSLYNNNIIGGAISKDSLEVYLDQSFPFDPESFESIFVINKNVEPILPGRSNMAYEVYLRAILGTHHLRINYREIGTAYNSLSTYSLSRDTRLIGFSDNFRLLSNRLNFSLGANMTTDNISGNKKTTTTNYSYFTYVFYNPQNLPVFNMGMSYNKSENDINTVEQINNSFNLGVSHYTDFIEHIPSNISLNYRLSSNQDAANKSFHTTDNHMSLNIRSELEDLPVRTSFSYGFRMNREKYGDIEYNMNSIALGAELLLMESRLIPFSDLRLSFYDQDSYLKNATMLRMGVRYDVTVNTFINSDIAYNSNNFRDTNSGSNSILSMRTTLTQRF